VRRFQSNTFEPQFHPILAEFALPRPGGEGSRRPDGVRRATHDVGRVPAALGAAAQTSSTIGGTVRFQLVERLTFPVRAGRWARLGGGAAGLWPKGCTNGNAQTGESQADAPHPIRPSATFPAGAGKALAFLNIGYTTHFQTRSPPSWPFPGEAGEGGRRPDGVRRATHDVGRAPAALGAARHSERAERMRSITRGRPPMIRSSGNRNVR
jgi:hypothetical protein